MDRKAYLHQTTVRITPSAPVPNYAQEGKYVTIGNKKNRWIDSFLELKRSG